MELEIKKSSNDNVKTIRHPERSKGCRVTPPRPLAGEGYKKTAFTLAEVLITLGIIGIVTALTLPSLIQMNKQRAWDQQKVVFEQKFREATAQMRVFGVLSGHKNTEEFIKELGKYMKFAKQCDNNNVKDCYAPKMILGAEDEVEVSDLTSASNLGHDDYNTNTMGLVVLDGVAVILAYDPKCEFIDPADTTKSTMACISMAYDINGRANPNTIGKDIVTWNAAITTCDIKINGLCTTGGDIEFSPITESCKYRDYDVCEGENRNNWAGAREACKTIGMRLPTMNELAKMASNQYGINIAEKDEIWSGLTINPNSKLNMSGWYWSSEKSTSNMAYLRHFWENRSYSSDAAMYLSGGKIRCVK